MLKSEEARVAKVEELEKAISKLDAEVSVLDSKLEEYENFHIVFKDTSKNLDYDSQEIELNLDAAKVSFEESKAEQEDEEEYESEDDGEEKAKEE